jgi:hypothetical protein
MSEEAVEKALAQIVSLQADNEATIARISRISTVLSAHTYQAICVFDDTKGSGAGLQLEIKEESTSTPAREIIERWKAEKAMDVPRDVFNDKLDYTATSYDHLKVRLRPGWCTVSLVDALPYGSQC